ncbi:MAG: hypothetical protein AAGH67_11040 [Cyanobacteria bacterium P01_H01_bin.162]
MGTQQQPKEDQQQLQQPLTPEDVSPEQRVAQREALDHSDQTINPGDVRHPEKSVEEKAQQVAVNTADITGDRIVVPTYFVVDDPEEGERALHHVDDAEEISDVIRQARVNEDGERTWR